MHNYLLFRNKAGMTPDQSLLTTIVEDAYKKQFRWVISAYNCDYKDYYMANAQDIYSLSNFSNI